MPLYFAYGSNMDRNAMAARCPSSRALGRARLARHRYVIMQEGYASVVRDPRGDVWGLLWDVALADMPALDRYEGVAGGLYRKVQQGVITEEGPRRALVYLGRNAGPGRPPPGYMENVVAAAQSAGLPDPYLRELTRWLISGQARPGAGAESVPEPRIRPAVTPTRASPRQPEVDRNANWSWEP
jgi:gamma-glutamylcyclotransferase (GGCT)/AIG2-like uncharacterized protein YtfP